ANQAADGLADHAVQKQHQLGGTCFNYIWEFTCPLFLNQIVTDDSRGRTYPRKVPT
ncbi:hypothetical protein MKW94_019972, partial [Papaver nudicaule]|nr:hypothetical protein [Papaver nudicaule]MCL7039976.1 hypothetical protein [Papaver nudicaule]